MALKHGNERAITVFRAMEERDIHLLARIGCKPILCSQIIRKWTNEPVMVWLRQLGGRSNNQDGSMSFRGHAD